jgi:predicted nucleic acid-binding protein
MKPLAIDTNAYVAFKRGEDAVVEVLRRAADIVLPVTVVGELLAGFAAGTRQARNRTELAQFVDSPRVRVVPVTQSTADNYALVYAALRRKGKPVPTNDLWIAASALEHGAALLTLDSHFAAVDGLRSGQELADFLP